MFPTVADVLELPTLRHGRPRVVAGAGGLGRRVRWTHVAEVPDIAHLLSGGELLLSTGVALPDDDDALAPHITAHVAFFVVITFHLGLVLKHQFVDRDRLLRRML